MEENNKKIEYVTRADLEEQTQIILNAMDSLLVKRITEAKEDLRVDINNLQTIIDGYVKSQEDFRQEFEIIKKEHDIMKRIIKEKLGLEISAV